MNSGGAFTDNSGAFTEYRVIACGISPKIPPSTALLRNTQELREILMNNPIKTQSKLAKLVVVASFLGLGGTALAQPVKAAEPTLASTVSYPVGYSDLDVSTTKGAKTLYLRIRYAAETLCESAATWGKKEGEACVNKAVNDAVAHVNSPRLTQYNQLHTKGGKAGPVQLANAN
ncbi:MAG: UrcA family protein [Steroidobacteraceae bacterium]